MVRAGTRLASNPGSDSRGASHAARCAEGSGPCPRPTAMTDAVVAALGLRRLSTALAVGDGGNRPCVNPAAEAQGRRDFYSDTAGARLCLVMVTCARSAPPPPRAQRWRRRGLGDGGGALARPWQGE